MLTIRRIKPSDSDLYKTLRLKSLLDSPGAFGTSHETAMLRDRESWISQAEAGSFGSDSAIFLTFKEKQAIGLAAIYRMIDPSEVGELMQVWVTPEHRGKGVGATILEFVMLWALNNKFRAVTAGIMEGNSEALAFYQKHGFVPETEITINCPDEAAVLIKEVI